MPDHTHVFRRCTVPGAMPESLKRKAEEAAVSQAVQYQEGPVLPDSMRHRAKQMTGAEIASAAAAHASGARPGLPGLPRRDPGEGIPANRDELYAAKVDYERMERGRVVVEKIAPWIEERVIENFGASIPRLVNMVCSKIAQREPAHAVEAELKKVRAKRAQNAPAVVHRGCHRWPQRPGEIHPLASLVCRSLTTRRSRSPCYCGPSFTTRSELSSEKLKIGEDRRK